MKEITIKKIRNKHSNINTHNLQDTDLPYDTPIKYKEGESVNITILVYDEYVDDSQYKLSDLSNFNIHVDIKTTGTMIPTTISSYSDKNLGGINVNQYTIKIGITEPLVIGSYVAIIHLINKESGDKEYLSDTYIRILE